MLFGAALLWIAGLFDWGAFSLLFTLLVVWVFADIIFRFFVGGGKGIGQIPATGNRARARGWIYLSFLGGILVASLVGSLVAETFLVTPNGSANAANTPLLPALSLMAALMVWADMRLRVYNRRR